MHGSSASSSTQRPSSYSAAFKAGSTDSTISCATGTCHGIASHAGQLVSGMGSSLRVPGGLGGSLLGQADSFALKVRSLLLPGVQALDGVRLISVYYISGPSKARDCLETCSHPCTAHIHAVLCPFTSCHQTHSAAAEAVHQMRQQPTGTAAKTVHQMPPMWGASSVLHPVNLYKGEAGGLPLSDRWGAHLL
jgi:hypothetical protein